MAVGDVVSSTKVYGYESGKAEVEFHPRPEVVTPNNFMVHLSRAIVGGKMGRKAEPSSSTETAKGFRGSNRRGCESNCIKRIEGI